MKLTWSIKQKEKTGLIISQIIIIGFLIVGAITFFSKDSIISNLLAGASFLGFSFLLIISLKGNLVTKRKR